MIHVSDSDLLSWPPGWPTTNKSPRAVIHCSCESRPESKQAAVQGQGIRWMQSDAWPRRALRRGLLHELLPTASCCSCSPIFLFLLFNSPQKPTRLIASPLKIKHASAHTIVRQLTSNTFRHGFALAPASLSYISQTELLIDGAAEETQQPPARWQRDQINYRSTLRPWWAALKVVNTVILHVTLLFMHWH